MSLALSVLNSSSNSKQESRKLNSAENNNVPYLFNIHCCFLYLHASESIDSMVFVEIIFEIS